MLLFPSRHITPLLIASISNSRGNADDLADYFLDRRRQHPFSNGVPDGVPRSLAGSFSRRKDLVSDF